MNITDVLLREKVIAILRGLRPPVIGRVVEALIDGGITCVEVTLESAGGLDTLASVRRDLGDRLHLGAGSITTPQQAAQAVDAGARYLVSPGLFKDVSEYALRCDVLYIPGVLSPTEAGVALQWGHLIQKVFPAGLMGPAYIRALRAPYPRAHFFAVGNIGVDDVPAYLAAGAAGVAMGSQLAGPGVDPQIVADRARLVRQAVGTGATEGQCRLNFQ